MKRIKAACICQVLHFQLKEDLGHDYAASLVRQEVEKYKESLNKSYTKYKIISERVEPDDSIIIEIIKQYNQSPVGDYLN